MSSKTFLAVLIGSIGISAAGLASADVLTEYGSLADWTAAVSDVSTYKISQLTSSPFPETPPEEFGDESVTIGPGVFTGDTGSAVIYNDGLYGSGIQYFSDDPAAISNHHAVGSVTVAFGASDDISALAFDLGAGLQASDIDISVNGSAVAPLTVSSTFPTTFFGVTDTKRPIRSITFSAAAGHGQEMDVINDYQTAVAAPEFSPASAPAALTFLIGLLVVLKGRRRSVRHTA